MGRHELLDGMRGLAAIIVALMHFLWAYGDGPAPLHGCLAVDFFFILSGYVIARSYEGRIAGGSVSFGGFLRTRLIRLYPLFLIGLALGLTKQVAASAMAMNQALPAWQIMVGLGFNLLMLPAPVPEHFSPLNTPAWSLILELLVNILFVVALARLRTRYLVVVALLSAICLAPMVIAANSVNIGSVWASFPGGIARVIFGFTTGMVLSRLVGTRAPRESLWALLPAAILLFYLCAMPTIHSLGFVEMLGAIIICPLVMAAAALLEVPRRLFGACRILGELSYPLYILHHPLTYPLALMGKKLGLGPLSSAMIFLGVTIAVAMICSRFIAEPVSAWLRRTARERRAQAATV